MISTFGDFDTTETVVIPFNTFDSNDPSASVTLTNLANTDVHIHKDGGLTQRSSAAGVVVDVDVDGIAGCHWVTIDLSDNTDAGFYADGSQYSVRVEGITVDAATLNPWIGAFTIGRSLRPTTAGRTLDVTATGAAGIDWGNIENKTTANDLSGTDIQLVDTATTLTGHTAQTGDNYARLGAPAGASVSADIADVPTVTEMNARTLVAADYFDPATDTVALVTDITTKTGFSLSTAGILAIWHQALSAIATAGSVGKLIKDEVTSVRMATLTDWINGGRLDLLLDAITPSGPTKTEMDTGHGLLATEAKQDIIDTNVDAILLDTAEIGAAGAGLTEAGGTGDHLTALPEVNANVQKINDVTITGDGSGTPFDV